MQLVVEQQVKFEINFARIDARFVHAEKRLDRLEEKLTRLETVNDFIASLRAERRERPRRATGN